MLSNSEKSGIQNAELQFLIQDPQAAINADVGAQTFFDSTASLDCFNMGLGIISDKMDVIVANSMFCNLASVPAAQVVHANIYAILGLKSHAVFAIRSILESDNAWSGKIRIEQRALRVDINRIERPFVVAGHKDVASYAVTLQDYSSEYQQLQQIADARSQAEKTDRAKSQFLSHMSHELRTPLNAILGFSQLLNLDDDLNELQRDNVREIESAGQFLLTLINEILDLSRIEAGKIQLADEEIVMKHLVDECIALVKPLAESKSVQLECHVEPGCHIRNDHVRLKQILINLLSNAIKYNVSNGSVALLCYHSKQNQLRIEVVDSGRGIDKEQLSSLFTPFERLDADKRNIEGTGIGLMITRRLVRLMSGEIGVVSSKGHGSLFWIDLPEHASGDAEVFANDPLSNDAWLHPSSVYWCGPRQPELDIVEMLKTARPEMSLQVGTGTPALLPWSRENPQPVVLIAESQLADIKNTPELDIRLKQIPVVVVTTGRGPRLLSALAAKEAGAEFSHSCKLTDFLPLLKTYPLMDKGKGNAN